MYKVTPLVIVIVLAACDTSPLVELREGSTSSSTGNGCEPPTPPAPSLEGCICEPDTPDACKTGLDCVPTGNDKEHACLARCGGGNITACAADGQEIACFYPFTDPIIGTGPAYCPVCLGCSIVPVGSMICQ